MSRGFIIKEGQVEYVENGSGLFGEEFDGHRIKVRISQDGDKEIKDLPWCFPFLPKTFQSVPKIGEAVCVLTSEFTNNESNRFYIGPVISQPQRFAFDPYMYGRGSANSLLKGGEKNHLLKSIKQYDETTGAFPDNADVALIGRKSEDIALKEGEIMMRSGARVAADTSNENLLGDVIFNTMSPAYIQLKFKNNLTRGENQAANSLVNIVADKINLISHQDPHLFNLTDNKEMIKESELDEIMSKLHQLPYGDLLVKYLNIMKLAVMYHGHNFSPGTPPIQGAYITQLKDVNFDDILSPNVRIS